MNSCCVKGPGFTYFALVSLSSLSIFLLPIVSHLIEPSGKYLNYADTNTGTAADIPHNNISHYVRYNTRTDNIYSTIDYSTHSSFSYREKDFSNSMSIFGTKNNIPDGTRNLNSSNFVHSNSHSTWAMFIAVSLSLVFYRVLATSAFTTLGIIVNDSVDKDVRGVWKT